MNEKELYKSLNKKERIVYGYVQKNKDTVQYMNIRDLSENCNVSTATVLRFVHKMGMTGYRELKQWCKKKEALNNFSYHTKEVIECLEKMENPLFDELLEEAASIIREADFVLFEGIGNSGGTALLGARYLSNYGIFSLALNDPFYNYEVMPKKIVIILLSSSGETKELIREMENFNMLKIPVICITSDENSTLGQMADLALPYYFRQQRKSGVFDMSSQIPAIYIIERLANKVKCNK